MNAALIFGVNGQDGSYLAEYLLGLGYKVVGTHRRSSTNNLERLAMIGDNPSFRLLETDVADAFSVALDFECVTELAHQNDIDTIEVYNLAAQSHVMTSFTQPVYTSEVVYGGCLNILEAISRMEYPSMYRFYQASSSEMFGSSIDEDGMQRETTPMHPCSPYAVAKLAAHNLVKVYRDSYGLFACSGILFNHESVRRGEEFVTRKITKYLGRRSRALSRGVSTPRLKLGNLEAYRDWGCAEDYVKAMHLMLRQETPDDFVIATGETHSVEEFLQEALLCTGVPWTRSHEFVEIDSSLFRPREVQRLCGDASKAKTVLGWAPKVTFEELVRQMIEFDLEY